jgi:hypothetical protein
LQKINCKTIIGVIKFAIKAGLVENYHFKRGAAKKLKFPPT